MTGGNNWWRCNRSVSCSWSMARMCSSLVSRGAHPSSPLSARNKESWTSSRGSRPALRNAKASPATCSAVKGELEQRSEAVLLTERGKTFGGRFADRRRVARVAEIGEFIQDAGRHQAVGIGEASPAIAGEPQQSPWPSPDAEALHPARHLRTVGCGAAFGSAGGKPSHSAERVARLATRSRAGNAAGSRHACPASRTPFQSRENRTSTGQ